MDNLRPCAGRHDNPDQSSVMEGHDFLMTGKYMRSHHTELYDQVVDLLQFVVNSQDQPVSSQ